MLKRLLFAAAIVLSAGVMATSAFGTANNKGAGLPNNLTFDEIQDRGSIGIAVYRDFPPFSYRESKHGPVKGIDVEIARLIAEGLEVELEIYELTADETVDDDLRNAIWKGHYLGSRIASVMMHVPYDREMDHRNEFVVLLGPYYNEDVVLASDPEKVGKNATLAPFRFEPIAVELDSIADHYLSGAFGGAIRPNVKHYRYFEQAAEAALKGETAGLMGPRSQVERGIQPKAEAFDVNKVPMPGMMKSEWLVGVAVSHKTRQLGYAVGDILSQRVKDGSIKDIFEAHGLTYIPPPADLLP
ncbi:MAG: transporter substrate-binding domain-containing protein [Magnetovibrionaceae bacterium]